MRRSDEVSDEVFGFHVQQAAEKALKARLALLGETYPLTHNLEALLDLIEGRRVATEPYRKLVGYTPYAVEFRYEGVDSGTEIARPERSAESRRIVAGRGPASVAGGRRRVIEGPPALFGKLFRVPRVDRWGGLGAGACSCQRRRSALAPGYGRHR